MNKLENSSEKLHDTDTFEKISQQLDKLGDILDITYGYEEITYGVNQPSEENTFFWNDTLFTNYIALNPDLTYDELHNRFVQEIDKDLNKFKELKKTLNSSNLKEKIAKGQVEYAEKILTIVKLGAPFELEKAGKKHNLTDQEVTERVKKIEEIDTELFDGKVTDDLGEVNGSIDFLEKRLEQYSSEISEAEQKTFKEFIDTLKDHKKENLQHNEGSVKEVKLGNTEMHNELTKAKQEVLDKKLSTEKTQKIFSLVFEIYGIEKPVKISDKHSSIYDGAETLYIPTGRTMSVNQLLKLIQHEIETHYIGYKNNEKLLGNVKGYKHLIKEEGTAKSMENLMLGKELNNTNITLSIPKIALGEILDGSKFKEFQRLYWKMKNKEEKHMGSLLRSKRNYPLNHPGVQHKDTTYSRGCRQVVEYLAEGGDPTELFRNKVSFEDMEKIKNVEPQDDEYTKPLLLGELLLYSLSGKEVRKEGFKEYIRNKYDFLDSKHLDGEFTYNQKKEILEILKEIKEE